MPSSEALTFFFFLKKRATSNDTVQINPASDTEGKLCQSEHKEKKEPRRGSKTIKYSPCNNAKHLRLQMKSQPVDEHSALMCSNSEVPQLTSNISPLKI